MTWSDRMVCILLAYAALALTMGRIMNKKQRTEIGKILSELRSIRDVEQDKFDNMPENFQSFGEGEQLQEIIDSLDAAIDAIEAIE